MRKMLLFLPFMLYAGIWTEPEPLVVQLKDGTIDTAVWAGFWLVTDPVLHRFWTRVSVDTGGRWSMGCIAVYDEEKNIWEEVVRDWPYGGGPIPDKEGNLWFIHCEDWIYLTQAVRYNFIEDKKYSPWELKWGIWPSCTVDSLGNVWVFLSYGEANYIIYYWYKNGEWQGPEALTHFADPYSQFVRGAVTDSKGDLWVGVGYLHAYTSEYRNYVIRGKIVEQGKSVVWSDTVWIANAGIDLCADREGNVWAVYCLRDGDSIEIDIRRFNGEEWEEPQVVWKAYSPENDMRKYISFPPVIIVDGFNRLFVVWIEGEIEDKDTVRMNLLYRYHYKGWWSSIDTIWSKEPGWYLIYWGTDPKGKIWVSYYNPKDKDVIAYAVHTTGVLGEEEKNEDYLKVQNFLNKVIFYLPRNLEITINIYDISGRLVRRFLPNSSGKIIWDQKDETGELLPSGVYFVRMQGKGFERTEKVVILR